MVVVTGLSGSERVHWPLIRCMRKVNVVMLRVYLHTPVNLGQMDKPDVDSIDGLSPGFLSTKRQQARILDRLWEL